MPPEPIVIAESTARFDGGAMFGHVPKVVWNRIVSCDEQNRVETAQNCLLLRDFHGRNILVETGMGAKWDAKERALYGLNGRDWAGLLHPHGLGTMDIDVVVLTHLHIDHAGGLTFRNDEGHLAPTFPTARIYVQEGEWSVANNPDPRSRPSYRADDFLPVEKSGQVVLVRGDRELFDGCAVRVTGGHTANHQLVRFDIGGRFLYFLGDILPSSAHLKPHWVMGYDLFPMGVMESRARILREIVDTDHLCVFGHDPQVGIVRLVTIEGRIVAQPITGVYT